MLSEKNHDIELQIPVFLKFGFLILEESISSLWKCIKIVVSYFAPVTVVSLLTSGFCTCCFFCLNSPLSFICIAHSLTFFSFFFLQMSPFTDFPWSSYLKVCPSRPLIISLPALFLYYIKQHDTKYFTYLLAAFLYKNVSSLEAGLFICSITIFTVLAYIIGIQ